MVFIQTRIKLDPCGEHPHHRKVVVLCGLVVDHVLFQVFDIIRDEHWNLHILFNVVGEILHPEHRNRIGLVPNAHERKRSAALTDSKANRRLIARIHRETKFVHVPSNDTARDFSLLFREDLDLVGSDNAKTSGFGLEVGLVRIVNLERDVADFESSSLPSEQVGRKRSLDTTEGK